ncbi:hypothetical protein [Sphingobacterium pedocola]|uniref:Uncharacterized protein n=1 Tax=Sphingobacterium pedocola TaxID=2082722 RepID=A0ABR9TC83_9SPHI|nr:hypothetical protein [Sphingobacterium pedocola]MBE8722970.1 hypothetical protein [Sphingobacterium pedocola]
MENLLQILIEQQKKNIKLTKKQNNLIAKLVSMKIPVDKEMLKKMLMDNMDLKELFKSGNTKFFQMKKLFKTYELNSTDFYLADEVLETIKKHRMATKDNSQTNNDGP